jgi:hypothetical protein
MTTKWGSNQEYNTVEEIKATNTNIEPPQDEYRKFHFVIPNYLTVPTQTQRFEFAIQAWTQVRDQQTHNPIIDQTTGDYLYDWQTISKYFVDVVIRQDLSDMMFSSVTKTMEWDGIVHDYYRYEIHNVPVILSEYLSDSNNNGVLNRSDNLTYNNFEISVLQKLVNTLYLADKRMLTDSINIKFCDTYGSLNNLKYNHPDYIVRSRFNTPFDQRKPTTIIFKPEDLYNPLDDIYLSEVSMFIINGPANDTINPEFAPFNTTPLPQYLNYIAKRFPEGSWHFIPPKRGQYVQVVDELDLNGREKILVYTGSEWKDVQEYQIPLQIYARIEIAKNSTTSSEKLIESVQTALISYFTPKMGIQKTLDRSEIIGVIRDVKDVVYCDLIEPETDIKYTYDIKDLTQEELIDYTPQYTGFNEQTIKIEVIE